MWEHLNFIICKIIITKEKVAIFASTLKCSKWLNYLLKLVALIKWSWTLSDYKYSSSGAGLAHWPCPILVFLSAFLSSLHCRTTIQTKTKNPNMYSNQHSSSIALARTTNHDIKGLGEEYLYWILLQGCNFFLIGWCSQTEGLNSRWMVFLCSQRELFARDDLIKDIRPLNFRAV